MKRTQLLLGIAVALLMIGCQRQDTETTAPVTQAPPDQAELQQETEAQRQAEQQLEALPLDQSGVQRHTATGTVTAVDAEAGTVRLAHDPVATLNWPAMTMDFAVSDPVVLTDLEEGERVRFEFTEEDAGQRLVILDIDEL